MTVDTHRDRRLLLWVVTCSGLATRGLWLSAAGGGLTPGWLLRAETGASGLAALSGLTALASSPRACTREALEPLVRVTTTAGSAALAIHGVRLVLYLRARSRT